MVGHSTVPRHNTPCCRLATPRQIRRLSAWNAVGFLSGTLVAYSPRMLMLACTIGLSLLATEDASTVDDDATNDAREASATAMVTEDVAGLQAAPLLTGTSLALGLASVGGAVAVVAFVVGNFMNIVFMQGSDRGTC